MENRSETSVSKSNKLLLLTLSAYVIVCFFIYLLYSNYAKSNIENTELKQLVNKTNQVHSLIQASIEKNKRNIAFLHSTPPVTGILRALNNKNIDPNDGTTLEQWKRQLETIFSAFIVNNPDIRQVRYVSKLNNGKEIVRVEKRQGKVVAVSDNLLQSKLGTEYYQAIKSIRMDQNYISDISLNREYGVLETPSWPTYRVARTILDDNYQFFGFIIINVDATGLLNDLQTQFNQSNASLSILNTDGYFISHKQVELTFGFDLQKPNATWTKLTNNTPIPNSYKMTEVIFKQQKHYMYNLTVYLSERNDRKLHIVGGLSQANIDKVWQQERVLAIVILLFIFCLITFITVFYQRHLNKILYLHDNQSRYEAIISGSSDAIINIDVNGKILSWNQSATYLFGLTKALAKTANINDIIGIKAEANLLTQAQLNHVINSKQPCSYDIEVPTSTSANDTNDEHSTGSNKATYLSIHLSPVIPKTTDSDASVAVLVRDVTEAKLNEQKILTNNEQLESEVTQRTKELELASQNAINASNSKTAFVANISHEIRTPLNGISGMLELINNENVTKKQENYIKLAKDSIANLTVLLNDLLNISKIESGKLDIELKEFNVVQSISSVLETMYLKSKEKQLDLRFDWIKVEYEFLVSDEYRFKQILINLINNAIKFTEKGYIQITAQTQLHPHIPGQIVCVVDVTDTGIGLNKEQQTQLFKPFSQATSSTEKQYGGTGLGLSISKQLTQLLGGDITVTSTEKVGSTFTFSLQSDVSATQNNDLLSTPLLLNKKVLVIAQHKEEYNVLLAQLQNWQAEAYLLNITEVETHISKSTQAHLLLIDSEVFTKESTKWNEYANHCKNCKLIILQDEIPPVISKTQNNMVLLEKPVLPYSLLSLIDAVLNHENTVLPQSKDVQHIPLTKHSILIVDDNEINLIVATGLLEPLAVEIETAQNGQDAINLLKNGKRFDLILMDCQMPVLSGFDATKLIREGLAGEDNTNIHIIAMTAGAMSGDKDACIQSGMNDFIPKPLDSSFFKQKVTFWLEQSRL